MDLSRYSIIGVRERGLFVLHRHVMLQSRGCVYKTDGNGALADSRWCVQTSICLSAEWIRLRLAPSARIPSASRSRGQSDERSQSPAWPAAFLRSTDVGQRHGIVFEMPCAGIRLYR